jgi:hypothetical protein
MPSFETLSYIIEQRQEEYKEAVSLWSGKDPEKKAIGVRA